MRRALERVARLSAVLAVGCVSPRRADAVVTQKLLDSSEKALQPRLSKSLALHLGRLCRHAAFEAARECLCRLGPVDKEERCRRNVDSLRVLLAAEAASGEQPRAQRGWRGVNLSGWLLWEPGPCDQCAMVRASGSGEERPRDEWTLCEELRRKHGHAVAERLVAEHRATRITRSDFQEIKALGLNAVRIPFPYWLVQGPLPGEPFVGPDLSPLDNAFLWAEEVGLKVVLCYHGTIGFQSEHHASGRANDDWDPRDWNEHANVMVLQRVATRYRSKAALAGIAVVNEPSASIPLKRLIWYYKAAYNAIRGAGVSEDVEIMFPVYHRGSDAYEKSFQRHFTGFKNIVWDVHMYQLFHPAWHRKSLAEHLRWASACAGAQHDVRAISQQGAKVVVSEWCLALPTWDERYLLSREWETLPEEEQSLVMASFARRQLRSFAEHSDGWFFWSWKDGDSDVWNLQRCIERGWLKVPPSSS